MDSKPGTRIGNSLGYYVLFSNYGDPGYAIFVDFMIDYNQSLYSPFVTKKLYMFWLCSNKIQYKIKTKQNKTKQKKLCPALIPYAVPYAGLPPALDLYMKGTSHDGVSEAQ